MRVPASEANAIPLEGCRNSGTVPTLHVRELQYLFSHLEPDPPIGSTIREEVYRAISIHEWERIALYGINWGREDSPRDLHSANTDCRQRRQGCFPRLSRAVEGDPRQLQQTIADHRIGDPGTCFGMRDSGPRRTRRRQAYRLGLGYGLPRAQHAIQPKAN